MKRALALAALTLSLCVQTSVHDAAAADMPKADLAKGKAVSTQVCAACHGADGNSVVPVNPMLAGQIPEYLLKQLTNFKLGANGKAERPNPVMTAFASALSPEDMTNVVAYFASQKPKPGASKNKDTVTLGQKLWRGGDMSRGIPACSSCHGASGAGLPVQYPRLAGQHADYMEAQLKAFRSGERANDAARVMRTIVAKMNDAQIKAVADYAAGLK